MDSPLKSRPFAALVAAIGWFALLLQFYLSIRISIERGLGAGHGVAIYFAFFTILTNLIAALVLTAALAAPHTKAGRFCARTSTIAGVAVNITLVGIAYNLLLRNVWNPQGWQLVADILLHDVVPVLFVAYSWMCAQHGAAPFLARVRWAAWPVVYFVYAMARGAITGFFPYPFLNAAHLGYGRVLVNAIGIVLGYFLIAAVLWALDRAATGRGFAQPSREGGRSV
ncbi:MAG TPA: Pr6Pr family membrane protein [Rudaea sp.]